MRLFVAIDVPEEVRAAFVELMEKLQACCPGARWVKPEGVHVTLKFIGEKEESSLEEIKEALRPIRMAEGLKFRYRGLGFFPGAQRPRVLWAGIESGPQLERLAGTVDEALAARGIPKETRPFQPHLTLARIKVGENVSLLKKIIESMGTPEFGAAPSESFRLYQSLLRPAGAEYISLAEYVFVEDRSCPTG
jgi:RNA 2',3'-cyclic 3'-phosphodiesterase